MEGGKRRMKKGCAVGIEFSFADEVDVVEEFEGGELKRLDS
ncbi:MAG: hypothetical protein ACI8S6_004862 [Myxococcota bacterium]